MEKLGNYELDNIYCEDCYEAIKKIPDKSIDLVIIDPPYEFCKGGKGHSDLGDGKQKAGKDYSTGGGCFGTKKRKYHSEINETDVTLARKKYLDYINEHGKDEESERLRAIASAIDNMNNAYFISKGISNEILDELVRVMKKVNIYVWCNKAQLRQLIDYFDDLGCNIDLLTWHKTNPIPTCNNTYLSDTEYCVFARESGVKVYGTVATKKKYYISACNVKDKKLYGHPTIKPENIISNLIINSSKEGDVVLDTFIGSGTTAVCAKNLNRHFIGFELNPKFHKIACDRLNGITQQDIKDKEFEKIKLF